MPTRMYVSKSAKDKLALKLRYATVSALRRDFEAKIPKARRALIKKLVNERMARVRSVNVNVASQKLVERG